MRYCFVILFFFVSTFSFASSFNKRLLLGKPETRINSKVASVRSHQWHNVAPRIAKCGTFSAIVLSFVCKQCVPTVHAANLLKDNPIGKKIKLADLEDVLRKFVEGSKISGTFLGNFLSSLIGHGRSRNKSPQAVIMSIAVPFVIFFAVLCTGVYLWKEGEKNDMKRFNNEVLRDMEYRENMYFEAVEKIQQKINDPTTQPSLKKELDKQLLDLDADKKIRSFLQGKSPRPVVKSVPNLNLMESSVNLKNRVTNKEAGKGTTEKPFDAHSVDNNKVDEFAQIAVQLEETLRNVLNKADLKKLRLYLQNRYNSIASKEKKGVALQRIKNKFGDNDYWIHLSKTLP